MNPVLAPRIRGLQEVAMAHYRAGSGLANATIGSEREIFVKHILNRIFPNAFRFSSGEIIDRHGNQTGQIDLVLEFPHEPSFPSPGSEERVIIAESVLMAFEIKSSWSQLGEIVTKCKMINSLNRQLNPVMYGDDNESDPRFPMDHLDLFHKVPVIGIIYNGPVKLSTLEDAFNLIPSTEKPIALLTLNHGYFHYNGNSYSGEEGIYAFICLLSELSLKFSISHTATPAYL